MLWWVGIAFGTLGAALAGIATAAYLGPGGGAFNLGNAAIQSAIAGFASGVVTTGNLDGGFRSGLSAMMFYGAGSFGEAFGEAARTIGHAGAGCAMAMMDGGDCGNGALTAGVAQFGGDSLKSWPTEAKFVASAVLGGTVSKLGGGKFANGARTNAFLSLFDAAAGYYERAVGRPANGLPGENRKGETTYEPDLMTGRQPPGTERMNVVGDNDLDSPCRQGSVCSKILNVVPGINATARLHDYWFNKGNPDMLEKTFVNNVGTMLPAAAISYGALVGNITRGWESNLFILTQSYDRN